MDCSSSAMDDRSVNDSSGDDSGDEWEALDEEVAISTETACLFCPEIFNTAEIMFQHCQMQHMFDLVGYSSRMGFNCITYIKFVNYIRSHKLSSTELMEISKESSPWIKDEYMKPFDANDPLLTFDIESFVQEKMTERGGTEETVTLPQSRFEAILQKLAHKEMKLQNAYDRIDRMKQAAKTVLLSQSHSSTSVCQGPSMEKRHSMEEDDFYFSTYDHFAIHHEMLQDKVRTSSYQDAILRNSELFQNKSVMDVGCGTAILAMFAAKAGATKVLAVDKSDVIYQAMDIVRENGFDKVIDLFKGRIEDIAFPETKVDIIVSEWMGYFLLFEGMLDSVIYARDHYLAPGGSMFPDRCTLNLIAVCDMEKYVEYINFWDNVYGFKMSVMKRDVIKEANVEAVKADVICSDTVAVKEFDLLTCCVQDAEFSSTFDLTMARDCTVTAVVGFFDSFFERGLSHKVVLSTSPANPATHWKQTMFLLPETVAVKTGDIVPCRISCRRNRRDPRSLIVKLNFGSCHNQYYLS